MVSFIRRGAGPRPVIVVGIDFSETSLTALEAAENLARSTPNAELHLVHALPAPPHELADAGETNGPDSLAAIESQLEQLVLRVGDAAQDLGRVTGHLRLGDPVTAIAQLASDLGADLVVVGTHGRTGVGRWVFGSVAEKVVRVAPCPVLTVRPKSVPLWEQIEPPCPDCVAMQRDTRRASLWCERHATHHPRAHAYYAYPASYGVGAQTFRAE